MATGGTPTYGIVVTVVPNNTGCHLKIERALNPGMSTSLTTLYDSLVKGSGTVTYTDVLPNDGVTRYYRATAYQTGYASGVSTVQSATPHDLSVS